MAYALDPLTTINLFFCIIIVLLGYWAYKKIDNALPLYIGLAFGLFGISHFAILIGYKTSEMGLIIIRTFAYLIVIFALYKTVSQR
ncbi:MAG: hypothetical protein FJ150_04800 [Euryarchaeota archaeon]|nr:hypothetical protein [Euryarchaeota archaeon]